eukprot:m.120945 g.120945  ORF g.120945 m.120945 type:complete len:457 (+) comp16190_c0_seq1:587-1957(+)
MADTCVDPGDTAWVMICTVLVLGMMPGLALFEAGLMPSSSTVSILTQVLSGMALNSVMWYLIGASLVYGDTLGGFIGSPASFPMYLHVENDECFPNQNIPKGSFLTFQMMFASISPLLLTGAFAERLVWKPFVILVVAWEFFVYYPVAHWMWSSEGWLYKLGARDFAGGIVIHTTAGVSAVVCALYLGRRREFIEQKGMVPPSNIPLVCVGGALLWMGWFGFNAGSALTSGSEASAVVSSTQIASAAASIVWLFLSWHHDKPNVIEVLNGAIAGLAGITPMAGYITPFESFFAGLILGFSSYFSLQFLRFRLLLDDAVDVSSVHGVTGVVGSILIGFFANSNLSEQNNLDGVFHGGNGKLLGFQILAVLVSGAFSGVVTYAIMWCTHWYFGFVVVPEDSGHSGLDSFDHGIQAYRHHNGYDLLPTANRPTTSGNTSASRSVNNAGGSAGREVMGMA